MSTKSQVTIFLIIGLIVGLSFLLWSLLPSSQESNLPSLSSAASNVQSFVQRCIDQETKQSAIDLAYHGGIMGISHPHVKDYLFTIPYYSQNNLDTTPSITHLYQEFEEYNEARIMSCVGDFSSFENQGIQIQTSSLTSSVQMIENQILLDVTFPISIIESSGSTHELAQFSTTINSPFFDFYQLALRISQDQAQNPQELCLDCLMVHASSQEVFIEVENFNEHTTVFTITDVKSQEPLQFRFAHHIGGGS